MTTWSEIDYQIYLARQQSEKPGRASTGEDPPEVRFMADVMRTARDLGFLVYHTHDSRRSTPGFPDLVLCNGHRVLFVELKRQREKPTREQILWLNLLRHTGKVEVYLWRPKDWPDVVTILRGYVECSEPDNPFLDL